MLASRILKSKMASLSSGVQFSRTLVTSGTAFGKVAVVLAGCGVYDGTEVHEAASCLAAITRHGHTPVVYAPADKSQAHVVDHQNGQESAGEKRSVVSESARIARAPVASLAQLDAADSDTLGVVFPGGFGAAKNLSDFAFKGTEMSVDAEVERVLHDFRKAGKPIALCCIAPILAAKVFGNEGVTLTLGMTGDKDAWPFSDAVEAARSLGANIVEASVSDVVVDPDLKVVTTPAFMYNGKFHEIQDGVKNMIDAMMTQI